MLTGPELDKLILLKESTNGFRNDLDLLPKKTTEEDHRFRRLDGPDIAREALGGSSVSFDREELLRAAWHSQSRTGLYSYGTPDRAIAAAEWMPGLTLASLGHQWKVAPACADRMPIKSTAVPARPTSSETGLRRPMRV